ncbi:5086_t:CDS:1, partial [Cetraspora pellucida]
KKRTPSSFILYKNKYKLIPTKAIKAHELESPDVRMNYQQCAKMIRLSTTNIILALKLCSHKFSPCSTPYFIISNAELFCS